MSASDRRGLEHFVRARQRYTVTVRLRCGGGAVAMAFPRCTTVGAGARARVTSAPRDHRRVWISVRWRGRPCSVAVLCVFSPYATLLPPAPIHTSINLSLSPCLCLALSHPVTLSRSTAIPRHPRPDNSKRTLGRSTVHLRTLPTTRDGLPLCYILLLLRYPVDGNFISLIATHYYNLSRWNILFFLSHDVFVYFSHYL